MKIRDLYGDWRIVGGFALMALGVANLSIGASRTSEWGQMIATENRRGAVADDRKFDDLEAGAGTAVLQPLTAEQRQVSLATARMDFYHATYLAGRVMIITALFLTLWGMIAQIQRDTRRALREARARAPTRA